MIIFWFHPVLAEIMNKSLVDGDQDTSSHQASNATTVETRTLGNLHLRLVGNRIKQRYKLCLWVLRISQEGAPLEEVSWFVTIGEPLDIEELWIQFWPEKLGASFAGTRKARKPCAATRLAPKSWRTGIHTAGRGWSEDLLDTEGCGIHQALSAKQRFHMQSVGWRSAFPKGSEAQRRKAG